MEELMNVKVGELAGRNFLFIRLFTALGIDFYCDGELPLKEAADEAGVDKVILGDRLKQIGEEPIHNYEVRIGQWPLDLLADYIEKTHHRYTEKTTMTLKTMVEHYLGKASDNEGIIKQFQPLLAELTGAMAVHMKREELTFFPAIRKMAASRGKADAIPVKPLNTTVDMFIHEHSQQHDSLVRIRKLFASYTLKAADDKAFNEIMLLMKELEEDLALHLHLENNLLFPKALRQQQLTGSVG